MKHIFLLCFVPALLMLFGCGNNKISSNATSKKLQTLLDQKEYFKLEFQAKVYDDNLSDYKKLYFKSFIDNAFNRNNDCINDVDQLLKNYDTALPDSLKSTLLQLQGDSYFKSFQYASAAKNDSDVLKRFTHILHKDEIDDIKNNLLIRNALKNIPAQQTEIKDNTTIWWSRNKLGLIEIPVKVAATSYKGIFDTRANISTISKTYAEKLKLHILNVSYNEGSGATGIQFKTGMGIADSLYIGDILVKNVVFQVMPDSILYIAPIKFQLNVIIGYPVIEQLKEIHVFSNGKMTIPVIPAKSDLHNFAIDGLNPVVALKVGNDTLAFNFDSGASTSDFYAAYFEKYKAAVLKNGFKKTLHFGGAGGVQKKEVYILPSLNFTLGNKTVTVDSVSVLTKKITPDEKLYGNIGQDFTNKFSEIIYNFNYMYIKGL